MTADHAAIRARLDAITHTPWKRETNLHGDQWVVPAEGMLVSNVVIAGPNYQPQNTEFIARAPEDMRALLDEVKDKDAQVAQLNEWLDEENAKSDTYRAEITRLLAVIDAAPHDKDCLVDYLSPMGLRPFDCDCWKARVGL